MYNYHWLDFSIFSSQSAEVSLSMYPTTNVILFTLTRKRANPSVANHPEEKSQMEYKHVHPASRVFS